ncbi:MAG: methyl-accepting chemotaxis protein [Desulfococcaceae bacterium]
MKTMSLRFRLVLGGILLAVIPILSLGFFSDMRASAALDRIAREHVVNIAKDLAGMIRIFMADQERSVRQISVSQTLKTAFGKSAERTETEIRDLNAELAQIMEQSGDVFKELFLSDEKGNVFSDGSGGKHRGMNIAQQGYFIKAGKGKTADGEVIMDEKDGLPLVPVCVPVFSEPGRFAGTLTAFVNLKPVSEQILSVRPGDTGYSFVADKKGIILIHPKNGFVLKLDITTLRGMESIVPKMLNQQTGVERYFFDNIFKIAGYAPVGRNGWTVAVTQPEKEFMSEIYQVRKVMIVFALGFLALGIWLVLLFAGRILRSLWKVVRGLDAGADQVSAAAHQIASASQSLAQNAAEQAAALEESSATMVEIAAMSRETSKLTEGGRELMNQNIEKSGYSLRSLVELTREMHRIELESDKVRGIISTIDEIAFQTSLLALNAAIEAARAGEAGSGFAVVANEVRNLAQRSTDAASATQDLLAATISQVSQAAHAIKGINDDFVDIIESATVMGEKTSAITAATKEQTSGIEQMSHAAAELEQVTQQMAAHSQETAAASEELSAQAEEMKHFVKELMKVIAGSTSRRKDE